MVVSWVTIMSWFIITFVRMLESVKHRWHFDMYMRQGPNNISTTYIVLRYLERNMKHIITNIIGINTSMYFRHSQFNQFNQEALVMINELITKSRIRYWPKIGSSSMTHLKYFVFKLAACVKKLLSKSRFIYTGDYCIFLNKCVLWCIWYDLRISTFVWNYYWEQTIYCQ